MRTSFLAASAVGIVLAGAACNRNNKAEQLAAIEDAYRSGILTQSEYEAKKAALFGSPGPAAAPKSEVSPSRAPRVVTPPPAEPRPVAPPAKAPEQAQKKSPFPEENASSPEPAPDPASPPPNSSTAESTPAPAEERHARRACEDIEYKTGNEKGKQVHFFAAPPARVKAAALKAFDSLDFTIQENAPNDIEASKRRNLGVLVGAGGERVLLHFEGVQQGGQNGTRVTGETKRNRFLGPRQKSWTNAVFAQTDCILSNAR
jgi:outer membrane biosynthesis protein TonB